MFKKVSGSGTWWIRFADGLGRIRKEKAGTKSTAINLYQRRKTEVLQGKKFPENLRSVTRVSDLEEALLNDYEVNKRKSGVSLKLRLRKHIIPFFGSMPANEVCTTEIDGYVKGRRDAGAANGTINRELAALKRMYRLAYDSSPRRVRDLLRFSRLKENAPRKGFVDDAAYGKLMGYAEELWLRGLLATAYTFGFRSTELTELRVEQINLVDRSICLDPGGTKNDEARTIKMTQEVFNLLVAYVSGKGKDDYFFTRSGQPVKDFRGAWWALCQKAGLGKFAKTESDKLRWTGLLFHDLRRSAVRNMVRAGIPEVVSMKISGHRSRSVFDRYNIVSESDLADAALKLEKRTVPRTDPRQAA